jgi:protein SCO1/2
MVNSPGMTENKTVFRILLVVAVVMMAGMVGAGLALLRTPAMTTTEMREKGLYMFESPRTVDSFALTDQHGEPFTNARLAGHWSLLFFGYTFCPDICPITMATLHQFDQQLQQIDARAADNLQVVMISVDPQRDTPEKLGDYVGFFGADYIGATGEFAALFTLARQLNATFSFQAQPEGEYLVSHSGEVMLINPDGRFHGFFRASPDPALMLETFQAATAGWESGK